MSLSFYEKTINPSQLAFIFLALNNSHLGHVLQPPFIIFVAQNRYINLVSFEMQNRNVTEIVCLSETQCSRLEGNPCIQEAIVGNHIT